MGYLDRRGHSCGAGGFVLRITDAKHGRAIALFRTATDFPAKAQRNSSALDGRRALFVQICDAAAQLTARLRRAGGICVRGIDAAAARTPAAPHVERRRRRLARLDAKAVRTRALRPCEKRGKK